MKIVVRILLAVLFALLVMYMMRGDVELEKLEAQQIEEARQCLISNYTNPGC